MSTHITDFNNHIQSYFISSTYGNETLVTSSLNHLALATDHRTFEVSLYANNVFFINLHKLMSVGTKKQALLWSAVSVLEAASKCESVREALMKKFHYLPTLVSMLQEVHNSEQQQRLLALIELLTHGVHLESHEPYVETFIIKLLAIMEQDHGKKERSELISLALSILVNLCYRNLQMTYLLTKNISISTFCGQIKQFGLLACKMYIILERNDYMKEMDLQYLLKMSFKEVRNVLTTRNSFILRHVVDYLQHIRQLNKEERSKDNRRNDATIESNFFRDNLKEFLEDIERYSNEQLSESNCVTRKRKRKGSDEKSLSNSTSDRDDCMDILFEILECILALEPIGGEFRKRIAEVALRWIQARQNCSGAISLLRVIMERCLDDTENADNMEELVEVCRQVLQDLTTFLENNTDEKLTISFYKLLATIVKFQKSSNSTLDNVAEQFFQQTFGQILNSSDSNKSFDYSLSDNEIGVYLWALYTFNEFANISPTLWFAKVNNLLKHKPIQFMIARGLTSGELDLTEAMLHVTASVDFPRREVSQMVGILSSNKRGVLSEPQQTEHRSTLMPHPTGTAPGMSRDLLERMNQTVSHIQDAVSAGHINDVTKVELIEFYSCKISMETQLMNDLRFSLGGMSSQINTLMHQNQLLSAEVEKVQRQNLPLGLKVSALETENRLLEKELNQMKNATASYDKKISQVKQELSEHIKKYSEKSQQCAALIKDVEMYRVRDSNYEKETKRLQQELADMLKSRDKSRKLLKMAEEDRQKLSEQKESDKKMYESKIREREREISKRNDLIQQLEQQLSQRDSKLESQESELQELLTQISTKDEKIAAIEAELKESESIQKAIYSLMNKGKK